MAKEGATMQHAYQLLRHRHLHRPAIRCAARRIRGEIRVHRFEPSGMVDHPNIKERYLHHRLHLPFHWHTNTWAATTWFMYLDKPEVQNTGTAEWDESIRHDRRTQTRTQRGTGVHPRHRPHPARRRTAQRIKK